MGSSARAWPAESSPRSTREATPAPAGDLVDYAAVLSEELSLLLGRKAVLSEKKGRGKIELFFDNADDREQLIQFLKTGNRK